ncbi:MAG: TIGR02300 family protein [Hyphomicrobiaceae bacterium]|nr:TIGR02300 family protein [Hyphomicrobiaceae bacterium]
MADKALRGTKRTCQSGSCGQRFYDLNRDPILCPICGSPYVIAHGPAEPDRDGGARRAAARKAEPVPAIDPVEAPVVEGEDALADVEGAEEAIVASDDEAFLEEEEDEGGDVSGILGGGGGAEDEET